jgi:hypothetical protein
VRGSDPGPRSRYRVSPTSWAPSGKESETSALASVFLEILVLEKIVRSKSLFISLALGILAVSASSQHRPPASVATASVSLQAVWNPDQKVLSQARSACQASAFPALGACFAKQMQIAGASSQAVMFMRQLNNEGYLQKFQETGRVDIAWVTYPFRANENSGCLLVNGTPARVDVDNLSQLPRARLNADRTWKALLDKHPKATLWSGDRSGATGVRAEPQSAGRQRFLVDYRVLDGCHACARLGVVRYAFNFAADGTFRGARYLDVREAGREDQTAGH